MRYRLYMQMNILLCCITCSDPIYQKDMDSHVKMALSLYDEAFKKKKKRPDCRALDSFHLWGELAFKSFQGVMFSAYCGKDHKIDSHVKIK